MCWVGEGKYVLFLISVDAIPGLQTASSSIEQRFSRFINSGHARMSGHECREMSELKWHRIVDLMGQRAIVKLSPFAQKVFHDDTFQTWLVSRGDKIAPGPAPVSARAAPASLHAADRPHLARPMSAPRAYPSSREDHDTQPYMGSGVRALSDRSSAAAKSNTAAGYRSGSGGNPATARGGSISSSNSRPTSTPRGGARRGSDTTYSSHSNAYGASSGDARESHKSLAPSSASSNWVSGRRY
jgi:hypothetical protein